MNRLAALGLAIWGILLANGIAHADLDGDIQAVLRDKLLQKADVGIEALRLDDAGDAKVIYRHQSDLPLIPASNLKIVTTSAALAKWGGDFKFRTLLVRHGDDLIVIGDGDPTLGDHELLKRYGLDVTSTFASWAGVLKQRGATKVGDVIVDDGVMDGQFVHPNWPTDQLLTWYEAPVGGLNLNAGVLNFWIRATMPGQAVGYSTNPPTGYATIVNQCVTGSKDAVWFTRPAGARDITLRGEASRDNGVPIPVTIDDPGLYAGTVLAETLTANGVAVGGTVRRDTSMRAKLAGLTDAEKREWLLVAVHETPLVAVLDRTNKDSMNLYAEALCKRLGFAVAGEGSWKTGTAAVGAFLKSIGVGEGEFTLDDGCGLSKENRISANAMARVLAYDHASANRKIFIDSLAVAGVDGTLDNRFAGTDLQRRVFAKSGYVSGVSALSGYIEGRDGHMYVFSILMNGVPRGTNSGAKQLQEKIVAAIDRDAGSGR